MFHETVEVLILGSGWTGQFLEPLLTAQEVPFASTSTTGRAGTIPFKYDPDRDPTKDDLKAFQRLPDARTVVIVFPLRGPERSRRLVNAYKQTHPDTKAGFIQLGSSGIFDGGPTAKGAKDEKKRDNVWIDRHTSYDTTNPRAIAEDELLKLSTSENPTTALNLCGLWGGTRSMRNYVDRLFPTKEALSAKGSIHMVHGTDVAQAILAVHRKWKAAAGQRWIVTDLHTYDWWSLAAKFGNGGLNAPKDQPAQGPHPKWVRELMLEKGIKALPRTPEETGRALDSREFWAAVDAEPRMVLD